MRFKILAESRHRIRIEVLQPRMSIEEADILQYCIKKIKGVQSLRVSEITKTVMIRYSEDKNELIASLQRISYEKAEVPKDFLVNSTRKLNNIYRDKLFMAVAERIIVKIAVPLPIRIALTIVKSIKYIKEAIHSIIKRRMEVSILDGVAIGASILQRDFDTASSVMFLLGIGELLEEWTKKKTTADLANVLSLNINKVWLKTEAGEVLTDYSEIKEGDRVVIHIGGIIPFDGVVEEGEALVNQASMTGESEPVRKEVGSMLFAGTVLEEGELVFVVKKAKGSSRFEKIVSMIEETQKLKSQAESRAERLADRLVPYTFFGTVAVYVLTRNITKALSVLMVDFSCALKLAMPVSVLSAIREAGNHGITVKGGKFLEAVAAAETIVFDKTGTLTKASPVVTRVVSFEERDEDELLRIAACLEEHFPHSMANAVVEKAREKGLKHEEMHSKVNYIVAHGISSSIDDKKVVIGSAHFVFEDEKVEIREDQREKFESLRGDSSQLYLAIDGKLSAVICISDPVREEAKQVIKELKRLGIKRVVMMSGDNEKTVRFVAESLGIDKYYAEVLPEDKSKFIEEEKRGGNKVIMVGDGINDSPALSVADCGIAISDGADIAREIADITIAAEDLNELVKLRMISALLMKKIDKNYKRIVAINGGLIALGVLGIINPATSAFIHNTSTLMIGIDSSRDLMK